MEKKMKPAVGLRGSGYLGLKIESYEVYGFRVV